MQLSPDLSIGHPALQISDDEVSTVVDLICRGVESARHLIRAGMLEVPITLLVRKAMRRAKRQLGLTNLEIRGEHELDAMDTDEAVVPGRIDISLKFLHQFGFEDAYLAVECKRVGFRKYSLNREYVTKGVARFASGKYAAGHGWGMMLGYVIALPEHQVTKSIDRHLVSLYGAGATLQLYASKSDLALATFVNAVRQGASTHDIRLLHIFVELTVAAHRSKRQKPASAGAQRKHRQTGP